MAELLQHPDRLVAFLNAIQRRGEEQRATFDGFTLQELLDEATEANLTTLPSIPFDTTKKTHHGRPDTKALYDTAYKLTGMTSNARRVCSSLSEPQAFELVERIADEMARETADREAEARL